MTKRILMLALLALAACGHAKESYDLNEYVQRNARVPGMAEAAYRVAEPLLLTDCTDRRSGVSTAGILDQTEFAVDAMRAIAAATGREVTRIILVDAEHANLAAPEGLDGSLSPGCGRCRIGTTFVQALDARHRTPVKNALGQGGWSKLDYRVRSKLTGVCEPGVRETVFYYLAYSTLSAPGDAAAFRSFDAVMQMLGVATPLGEKVDEPGAWYVKVQ
jgi:hypothetical protein